MRGIGQWGFIFMKRLVVLSGCGLLAVAGFVFPVQAQDYSGAGQITAPGVSCTGVAISPTVVLSAAHCYVNEDTGTLKFSPSSVSFKGIAASTIDIAPGGFSFDPPETADLDNDLVAITLSSILPTDVALYSLYEGTVQPTQTEIVFVHNDGSTGNNVIDRLGVDGTTTFLFDIDGSTVQPNSTGGTAIPGEDKLVVSDSGGPSFILDGNNVPQLLGINTFAGETTTTSGQVYPAGEPGSVAGGILLSYYGDFLAPYLTPVPEPTAMAGGLLSGLLLLGVRARRGRATEV